MPGHYDERRIAEERGRTAPRPGEAARIGLLVAAVVFGVVFLPVLLLAVTGDPDSAPEALLRGGTFAGVAAVFLGGLAAQRRLHRSDT